MRKVRQRALKEAFKKANGRYPNKMLIIEEQPDQVVKSMREPSRKTINYYPSEWRKVKKGTM